jgi:hypothetical protein
MVATIFSQGRFHMRKVLLATTALVALNVSAASADISISGSAVFEYYSPTSGTTTYDSDGSLVIKASSTADNGLTFSAVNDIKWEGASNNDNYIEVKGDFGSVQMGFTDNALDRKDGNLATNMDLETTGGGSASTLYSTVIAAADDEVINVFLPAMNGVEVYGFNEANGAASGVGANLSIGNISLMIQSAEGTPTTSGTTSATALGAKVSAAGFTVQAGMATKDKNSASAKIKSSDIGVSYSMGDIKLVATSAKGKQGSRTDKYSNIGVSYAIAPGVTAIVESGESTVNSTNADATFASITVAF